MILEYKCSNFKSIKDEVIFSMLASYDTSHSEKLLHFQNREFNRLSVVCGANGSEKSTLFDSLFDRMIRDVKFREILVKTFNGLGVDVKDIGVCEDNILFAYGVFSVDLGWSGCRFT